MSKAKSIEQSNNTDLNFTISKKILYFNIVLTLIVFFVSSLIRSRFNGSHIRWCFFTYEIT